MSNLEQYEIQIKIAQIIERSRQQEERFLVDSRSAASDIIQYLQKRNLLESIYQENVLHLEN